ncbi:MAG: hypothetical protein ACD_15C00137G0022 [uncultured bacterium]|nr:MAG: hypothetical protein ACD_15C00137G0022 [uncultured bacterium]
MATRKARLALIEPLMHEIKERLNIPGGKLYPVRRDFSVSHYDTDNKQTGYGLGFRSFFLGETKRRLIEIDCMSDGNTLESPLFVEIFFDRENYKKIAPLIERFVFRQDVKRLFKGVAFNHYGHHVTEFDQMVESYAESLKAGQ